MPIHEETNNLYIDQPVQKGQNITLLSSINGADLSVQDLRLRWMNNKVEILTGYQLRVLKKRFCVVTKLGVLTL